MLQPPTKFEVNFVDDTLSVSALIGLVTILNFDLLTSNLVSVIACEVGNFLNKFDVLGTTLHMGQANTCRTDHVTLRPWPLTLELMALIRYGSSCFIHVYQVWSSWLPVRKMWQTFISTLIRMVTLTFELLTFKLVRFIVHCYDLHMVMLLI